MNIFIDIETLPTDRNQQIDYVAANVKAPGNYKKQEAIEKYIADNRDEAVSKTALSGLFGQVYMVGLARGDEDVSVIRGDSERDVLVGLRKQLIEWGALNQHRDAKAKFIGHNAKDFDLPFLSQRLMVHGFGPLWRHESKSPVMDTMQMFACGRYKQYYSLDALCLAFGIESPKSEIDGSMVHQYYLDGRHDEVAKYCADDVRATRLIYNIMTQHKAAA